VRDPWLSIMLINLVSHIAFCQSLACAGSPYQQLDPQCETVAGTNQGHMQVRQSNTDTLTALLGCAAGTLEATSGSVGRCQQSNALRTTP
jgi:hypothetical protein